MIRWSRPPVTPMPESGADVEGRLRQAPRSGRPPWPGGRPRPRAGRGGYPDLVAELAGRDPRPDGAADVWWARRQDASGRLAALLDETERRRWAAYRRPEDRDRFLAGCALAKAALARYTGQRPADVRFDRTCGQCGQPHGK